LKSNSATLSNGAPGDAESPTIAVHVALVVLRAYKLLISPLVTGACRFTPSCSDYTAEAIRRFGVVRGVSLGVMRLGRCHPFCAGGHDPVPPRI
jgi:putative membrane protein insertion efficiency factor